MTERPADPIHQTFAKCARELQKLPSDDDRRRVIRAFAVLLGMEPFQNGEPTP